VRTLPLWLALVFYSHSAFATEPWIDPDPPEPPQRYEIGAVGVAAEAEYRAQFTFVNPISVNTENNRRYNVIEHRGRFGATVDYDELVKISTSFDLLDSVLWGDNGTFGGDPTSEAGVQVTARDPNVVRPCITYGGEGNTADASSYGWGLCEADVIKVRRLFAQVNTPIGALRVGRQPVSVGMGVQTVDGDGRKNRFGVEYGGDQVDRVIFATKPLEALKPPEQRDTSETVGLITAVMYDRWVSDSAKIFSDDLQQVAAAVRYLEPDIRIGKDLEAQVFYAHRWNTEFVTRVNVIGGRLAAVFERFHIGVDMAGNIGTTEEISAGYSVITNDPIVGQDILQFGGRLAMRYDTKYVTPYIELDYASGDGDPTAGTPLSEFRWSEDTNVGLLLFEHIVHFQSARASAAGVAITQALGGPTFPAERVNTRGAFSNAAAVFPQIDIKPHETILFRLGALFAWAPEPVINPVQSLQSRDGTTIEDDLVNYVGGKPGTYYGTEIDGRFRWTLYDHFALDLEGAVLFPGDVLKDRNGAAVHSFLTQGRTTFYF
jgi:hypothetical protein